LPSPRSRIGALGPPPRVRPGWPPRVPLLLLLLPFLAFPAAAGSLPITVDGRYDDWSQEAAFAFDPAGDGGGSGIDFRFLAAANDADWLYLRFDTGVEVQPDENQAIRIYLDTDDNQETGVPVGAMGADLIWSLGSRDGRFYFSSGGSVLIEHAAVGLVIAPTVSAGEFELCFSRRAAIAGVPLFPGSRVRIALTDGVAGDTIPGPGGLVYDFEEIPQPVAPLPLTRESPEHVRLAAYNIQSNGLFSGGTRGAAVARLFRIVDADIWIVCEQWDFSAVQARDRMEELLPSGPGETWHTLKRDEGNILASRFPILASWDVLPGNRLTAALLDLRPLHDRDLLVVANHWSCCTADDRRQEQADALVAFLRDARTEGGRLDLASDTPFLVAGDLNLVGVRQQIETLIEGDIQNEARWGPDAPPDWDGSPLKDANSRHPDARFAYTWRNDSSSFYPGKLDWILYTGSAAVLHNHYVLETRTMTDARLAGTGLRRTDTPAASDHAIHAADFTPRGGGTAVIGDGSVGPGGLALLGAFPNPFREATAIRFELLEPARVHMVVVDVAGRRVRELLEGRELGAGRHLVAWEGEDASGNRVSSGVYFLRAWPDGIPGTVHVRRVLRVR